MSSPFEPETIKANVVFLGLRLLPTQDDLRLFTGMLDGDVRVEAGIVIGPSQAQDSSRRITLDRERITLETSADRSVIQQDYPPAPDFSALVKTSELAVFNTPSLDDIRGFGFNIDFVYKTPSGEPASLYVATHLFPASFALNEGWHMTGGSTKLSFQQDSLTWNADIAPRFEDATTTRVFFHLNLHKDDGRVPDSEEVASTLEQLQVSALTFIQAFDKLRSDD